LIDIHEMTVLIVDDMASMSKSVHNMMKIIGYGRRFLFAHSGEEAEKWLLKAASINYMEVKLIKELSSREFIFFMPFMDS